VEEVSGRRASLFLGAGASREASFPSTEDLANYLAKRAGSSYWATLKNRPLDVVAQHLYMQPGYGKHWIRHEIIEYLEEQHRRVERPPSLAHETMTKIQWRTLFTTNYDRLVEIAYGSSSECVQRLSPIYAPDPQIWRHEAKVVRLIKLNGSVDEAARNSSHELVITFSEQQDARSRNKDFYALLRQEAINGPIIFVGFSFTYPGALTPGTSPELQLLRELMREMGPATQWHYCITPLASPSDEASRFGIEFLHDNHIQVIDATFGEFLDVLNKQLTAPSIPLAKQKPIIIPVAQTSIQLDAEEYEKDRRHFEILGSHVEELTPPPVEESLNGGETWASFLEGHLIDRFCKDNFRALVMNCVRRAPEILFFSASPGWGKTFLLRDLAIELYRERRPVIWLNTYSTIEIEESGRAPVILGKWDAVRINHILGMIENAAEENSLAGEEATPIIIADNCPERAEEVLSLFRDLTSDNRSFVLIFTARDNEFEASLAEHPLLRKATPFQPELHDYDSKGEVRRLIDFCTLHKVAAIEDVAQRDIVAQRIIREEAGKALILALQVIFDKEHRPFSEIVSDYWHGLKDENSQALVLRVASLHRFGSAFSPRLYSLLQTFPAHKHFQVLEAYRDCLDKGVLFERISEEEPCVYTRHSLVAEHIVKVSGRTAAEVDDELLNIARYMTRNVRDLELVRRVLKRINDYKINLSSEDKAKELFRIAADSMNNDWVVCQQFSKFLVQRGEHELALAWAERALETNPDHASLHHSKGNILRRWGMELQLEKDINQAEEKFQEARKCFAISRVRPDPDEYGYVTHLDMLLYLMRAAQDEFEKANLLAEGAQLYREGLRAVSADRFNLLLENRFRQTFDLRGESVKELCQRIEGAVENGQSSVYAAAFLAQHLYEQDEYDHAVEVLQKQREISDRGVLTWVKEAELHAREGHFDKAARCIDSAKRRQEHVETMEALWALMYWDLLIAIVLEEFRQAGTAAIKLRESGFLSRQNLPRGYIWKQSAKQVKPKERSFKRHAKIWSGRIEDVRASSRYGRITLANIAGENFHIDFNPRYFGRRDLRRGEYVKFVITFLSNRVRAEDVNLKPFVNTIDDIFVP